MTEKMPCHITDGPDYDGWLDEQYMEEFGEERTGWEEHPGKAEVDRLKREQDDA